MAQGRRGRMFKESDAVVTSNEPVPFDVRTHWEHEIPVVRVAGELDVTTETRLSTALKQASVIPGGVAVDLSRVSFTDATGLSPIANLARSLRRKGLTLEVREPQQSVLDVFDLLRLTAAVDVCEPR
jgi:anti-anti-sigma factor